MHTLTGACLLPLHGVAEVPPIELPAQGDLVLGRDPGKSGIRVVDPFCSRLHAAVVEQTGSWSLRDLGSRNGTWLNDVTIRQQTLSPGDHIRIGNTELAFVGPDGGYRCASCMETIVTAPRDSPFCTECRHLFPLLGSILKRRRMIRGLGTGTFGSCYLAQRFGRPHVAVKVLHLKFTEAPESVMKFLREAYATSGLEHENIVRFGEPGYDGGHWFITLEYFHSRSLLQILEAKRFLPLVEAMPIMRQMLSAVEYAHSRRVLHRDLKPANILVNDAGAVKLIDFGLAKRLLRRTTSTQTTSSVPGTPLFMAPELLVGTRATVRSDIYSLAATFYRMLAGRHPIEPGRLDTWIVAIQTQKPPPANALQPDVPRQVSDALAKALEKDPQARQASVAEFRRELGFYRMEPTAPQSSGGAGPTRILPRLGPIARTRKLPSRWRAVR